MSTVLIKESVTLFGTCKLIGDYTGENWTEHGSRQMAFNQTTNEKVNVVD
jgi:hypothetical protein